MANKDDSKILLSRSSLNVDVRAERHPFLFPIICVAVGAFFLGNWLKGEGLLFLLFGLLSLAVFAFSLFLFSRDRENAAKQAQGLRNGQLYFVKNMVTDKETYDASSGDSPVASPTYLLYFHKAEGEGRRCLKVDQESFQSANVGNQYYLLYVNHKLVRAYPCRSYRLDEELEKLLVKDKKIVGVSQYSEYEQYWKLQCEKGLLAKREWLKTHKSIPKPP